MKLTFDIDDSEQFHRQPYFDSVTGSIGFGTSYGEFSSNGVPLYSSPLIGSPYAHPDMPPSSFGIVPPKEHQKIIVRFVRNNFLENDQMPHWILGPSNSPNMDRFLRKERKDRLHWLFSRFQR